MGNILNHNRRIFQFDLNKEDYWDFHICLDNYGGGIGYNDDTDCLAAYIDFSQNICIFPDGAISFPENTWVNAKNTNNLILENFGYTSVDNGRTFYDVDTITNKEFFDIFTNTTYTPPEDDVRLRLYKIHGNHKLYDYSTEITVEDNIQCAKLNGGWYQGFFCANDGCDYKVLPTDIDNGWTLEFTLKKEDFHNDKMTMNKIYPENKGIFFYIGTRAENKWWLKYLTEHDFDWCKKSAFNVDYVEEQYIQNESSLNDSYIVEKPSICPDECGTCSEYVEDEYIEKEMTIEPDAEIKTSDGFDISQPNIKEYETDNKFLFFNRTPDGFTADKWDGDERIIMNYLDIPPLKENYFTLFHRGIDGYDVKKIQELLIPQSKKYNVLKDLYRNALAFQIKEDGSIGYKFLVQDCDAEKENYKILSEYSKPLTIKTGEWANIAIKLLPVIHRVVSPNGVVQNAVTEKMQIYIYVNAKLVFVSKELPMLNLKNLDDLYTKQEGVPFNISLGGGTQGLAETVYLDYRKLPEFVLPLEKEFGGSFIGFIKSFKFYSCRLNFTRIGANYNHFTSIYYK